MPSIVIRLDPAHLSDPDLDLRYEIPNQLAAATPRLLVEDGYDYEDCARGGASPLLIFLRTPDIEAALPVVFSFLEHQRPHGNDLTHAVTVGVSERDPPDELEYRRVFPPGSTGVIRVTP